MIIQPLIENSLIHGISQSAEGGKIMLSCTVKDDFCNIKITDTGKGFNKDSFVKGFGIGGVEERLELLYGDNFVFNIISNTGVKILISIPLNPLNL